MTTAPKMQDRAKALFTQVEIDVITAMKELRAKNNGESVFEITEVSFASNVRDNDETLRALYTLEGKSLVQPDPVGDFTSSRWKITEGGVRAAEML